MDEHSGELIRGRFEPRVGAVFVWLAQRMLRKAFAAVRLEASSRAEFESLRGHHGPVIVLINHPSWWDPMVLTFLWGLFLRPRVPMAPMDARELRRFRIFTRIGVFGLDPDNPHSVRLLMAESERIWSKEAQAVLMITPQGHFTDPRQPIELRPGAALVAARRPRVAVLAVAVEYPFWSSKKPEVLLRARRVPNPGESSPRKWLESMSQTMADNGAALASLTMARSARPFETLIDGERPRGPYALWLRLTGRGSEIDSHERRGGSS
ncbi:MAG: lysophospholipid acyltransferase family protein [Phycisphaeraceae bacterium]|nr:lysophospholipid acyltransferase family protein [Phycisphaeraceae bacterium]